jgi:hypothetical protein
LGCKIILVSNSPLKKGTGSERPLDFVESFGLPLGARPFFNTLLTPALPRAILPSTFGADCTPFFWRITLFLRWPSWCEDDAGMFDSALLGC